MAGFVTPRQSPSSSTHDASTIRTTTLAPAGGWGRDYDEGDDVTAPKSKEARYMNQSFIFAIANLGMSTHFAPNLSNVVDDPARIKQHPLGQRKRQSSQNARHSPLADRRSSLDRRIRSDDRMLQSSPGLSRPTRSKRHVRAPSDIMLQSQILTPPYVEQQISQSRPDVPPLPSGGLRIPEKIQIVHADVSKEEGDIGHSRIESQNESVAERPSTVEMPLAEQLASMFGLDRQEEVIAGEDQR